MYPDVPEDEAEHKYKASPALAIALMPENRQIQSAEGPTIDVASELSARPLSSAYLAMAMSDRRPTFSQERPMNREINVDDGRFPDLEMTSAQRTADAMEDLPDVDEELNPLDPFGLSDDEDEPLGPGYTRPSASEYALYGDVPMAQDPPKRAKIGLLTIEESPTAPEIESVISEPSPEAIARAATDAVKKARALTDEVIHTHINNYQVQAHALRLSAALFDYLARGAQDV